MTLENKIDYNRESFALAASHASTEISGRGKETNYAATRALVKKLRYGAADIKCHENYEQFGLWELVVGHFLRVQYHMLKHDEEKITEGLEKIASGLQGAYEATNPEKTKNANEIMQNIIWAQEEFRDPNYRDKMPRI